MRFLVNMNVPRELGRRLAAPELEVPAGVQPISADSEYSGGCPHPQCVF